MVGMRIDDGGGWMSYWARDSVQDWIRGLKEWGLWLMGDSPLPARRSRLMLFATVLVAALLSVGVLAAYRSPALRSQATVPRPAPGAAPALPYMAAGPATAASKAPARTSTTMATAPAYGTRSRSGVRGSVNGQAVVGSEAASTGTGRTSTSTASSVHPAVSAPQSAPASVVPS